MIFYQITTSNVTTDLLADCLLNHLIPAEILNFNFHGYSNVKTLKDALNVVERKRLKTTNPYSHTFLCFEIEYEEDTAPDKIINSTDKVADGINSYYLNDLFIISIVFKDEYDKIHAFIFISDLEKSLQESSDFHLSEELLCQLISECLPKFNISPLTYHTIYVFWGEDSDLAYENIFHVKCCVNGR